jgi:hypothetical protein
MIRHENYSLEIGERRGGRRPVLVTVADLTEMTDREKLIAETAYRRGYFQGFYTGTVTLEESGHTFAKVADWMYRVLFRWRYKKHNGDFEQPPIMKGKK